ncbi:MAG: flagellar basal body-associated FliL family protein [Salinisphaeraceae bacterium]|nr:flagellar basal body-associated FliL family protein [Salinisphaeraceae bacterium]
MAEATMEDADNIEPGTESPEQPPKKGKKGLIIAIITLLILGGGGFAAWQFFLKPAEESTTEENAMQTSGDPQYLEITPNFVVNLEDPDLMRYLQLDLQIMARDAKTLAEVETYMPEIRNNLLLMFAQQKYEQLLPRSGKEALQKAALEEINKVLKSHGGKGNVEAVLFTSFVMQ